MAAREQQMLGLVVRQFLKGSRLTAEQRREVLDIAGGVGSRDAATLEGVPVETVRARRKIIYRKLRLSGSSELMSRLLAISLRMLARPGRK